jgi:hypothetical protein
MTTLRDLLEKTLEEKFVKHLDLYGMFADYIDGLEKRIVELEEKLKETEKNENG